MKMKTAEISRSHDSRLQPTISTPRLIGEGSLVDLHSIAFNFFINPNGSSSVNINLNNQLTDSWFMESSYMALGDTEQKIMQPEVKKLGTSENILGYPCEHYLINYSTEKDSAYAAKDNLKICINEGNSVNNVPVMNALFEKYSRNKVKNIDLKGLIVKLGSQKDYDQEHLVLKKVEDTKDFVLFDQKKALGNKIKIIDSIQQVRLKWQKESIADSAAVALIDSIAATKVDSAAAIDPDGTIYNPDYYIPQYKSEYKKHPQNNSIDLAINSLPSTSLKQGLPKYCFKIEEDMPLFQHGELRKHLHNYVGQICDLYLLQSQQHNVYIKGTIDEVRRESLYLQEIRKKLNKKDLEKLDQYLKSLD